MKTIGIIGGLSWQSTIDYYRIINERQNELLQSSETGEVLVYSVNLEEMLAHVGAGEFDLLGQKLHEKAVALQQMGAEIIVLATNTMHLVADQIAEGLDAQFLHITDALAAKLQADGVTKVGLIGTPFTMSLPFYRDKLAEEYGIEVITPPESAYDRIYDVIRNELTFNIIREESRKLYLEIFEEMRTRGAQGVILGCTEIPMLIKQEHTDLPVYSTTDLHALAAADLAAQ